MTSVTSRVEENCVWRDELADL